MLPSVIYILHPPKNQRSILNLWMTTLSGIWLEGELMKLPTHSFHHVHVHSFSVFCSCHCGIEHNNILSFRPLRDSMFLRCSSSYEVNVCLDYLDEYELFDRPRVAGHYTLIFSYICPLDKFTPDFISKFMEAKGQDKTRPWWSMRDFKCLTYKWMMPTFAYSQVVWQHADEF